MSIARSLSTRCMRQLRAARPTFRSSTLRRPARRGYSNASDAAHKAQETAKKGLASEMPWLIGAIAVTVPGTYLILNAGKISNPLDYPLPGSHYHGGEHDEEHEGEHEEEVEEGEEKPEGEEAEADQENAEDEDSDEKEKSGDDGDKAGDDDDDSEKRADTNTKPGAKEGKSLAEVPDDNKISSKTKDGGDAKFDEKQELESDSDSKVIHQPDAKGGAKRRIESPYGNKLGKEEDIEGHDTADKAAPSKEPTDGMMSGKQKGISNTDTKHSTPDDEMDKKSKKAEGGPETAKHQGTVDPGKPIK